MNEQINNLAKKHNLNEFKHGYQLNLILEHKLEHSFSNCINDLLSYLESKLLGKNDTSEVSVNATFSINGNTTESKPFKLTNNKVYYILPFMHFISDSDGNTLDVSLAEFSILLNPVQNEYYKWIEAAKRLSTIFIIETIKHTDKLDQSGLFFEEKGNDKRLLSIFNNIVSILEQFLSNDVESNFELDIDDTDCLIWRSNPKEVPEHSNNDNISDKKSAPLQLNPLLHDVVSYLYHIQKKDPSIDYFFGSSNPSTLKVPPVQNTYFDNLAEKINSGKEVLVTPRELSTILYPNDEVTREKQLKSFCKLLYDKELDYRDEWEGAETFGINDAEELYKIISNLDFALEQYYVRLNKQDSGKGLSLDLGEKHGNYHWEKNEKKHVKKLRKCSPVNIKQLETLQILIKNLKLTYKFDIDKYVIGINKITKEDVTVNRIKLPFDKDEFIKILKGFDSKLFRKINEDADIRNQNFWRLTSRKQLCIFKGPRNLDTANDKKIRSGVFNTYKIK